MTYQEFQEKVFNHLLERHKQSPSFKFSVRQKASKGAEKNYFIGKQQSGYFGFTFWDTPVYYPGSSSDLTDFIFWTHDDEILFKFQFIMSKTEYDEQSIGDLELGYEILNRLIAIGIEPTYKRDNEKGLNFEIITVKGLKDIKDLLNAFDDLYSKIAPQIDDAINSIKQKRPEWVGGRYSDEKFESLISKMHTRIERFSKTTPIIVSGASANSRFFLPDEKLQEENNVPVNIILYGPPGTGKTYHTINKALEIIDPDFYLKNQDNRDQLIKRFKELQINDWNSLSGQIAFSTFHQSMSYEDFVEGIKPLKPKPNEQLAYDIEDGIFKRICKLARSNYESAQEGKKLLPFEDVFESFKEVWENDPKMKFPLKTPGYDFEIIGFSNTSIQFRKASGGTSHTLSINTLKEQYYGKEYDFKQGVGIYYPPILKRLNEIGSTGKKAKLTKYVLIIDEVNRANVSQVFGELITLLEEDKRMGNGEALQTILPYSKETFSVPSNVYLIGTMNTADRSVEALDTALRRRFSFQEMMPDESLLSPQQMIIRLYKKYPNYDWDDLGFRLEANNLYKLLGIDSSFESKVQDNERNADDLKILALSNDLFTGLDLEKCLNAINKRLVKLLSKDHQLGQAFLVNIFSIEALYDSFYQKIIPQLQEYFYGDFGKIGLVLGSSFVEETDIEVDFANFNYDERELLLERKVYLIKSFTKEEEPDFDSFFLAVKSIYTK
jgi:5-methylcytosine-specific restriction endonuclease McrBC GTP-binding regulatory subunit McrB